MDIEIDDESLEMIMTELGNIPIATEQFFNQDVIRYNKLLMVSLKTILATSGMFHKTRDSYACFAGNGETDRAIVAVLEGLDTGDMHECIESLLYLSCIIIAQVATQEQYESSVLN